MKTFRLHYSKLIVALSFVTLAVCIGGFALNVWRFIDRGGFTDFYTAIEFLIVAAVTVFAPVLLLTVVFHSTYTVDGKEFATNFGFIKSKFSISEMTELVYNVQKRKLAVYTGENYMVFRLEEEWDKAFISALQAANKHLLYNETEDEEDEPVQKDPTDRDKKN